MRHWGGNHRAQLMCGAACVSAMLVTAPATAWAQDVDFDIPPQSLSAALDIFAAQSRQPILVTPDMTANKLSRGVSGAVETDVALAQLLAGTGLTYRVSGKTFLIVQEGAADPQSESAAGGGAEGTVDALIVTAQKREEDIQDVPIAISAFTQEDLTRSQVAGGPDLITQVPNFTFTKTNFSSYSIQIRGIGTQAISATTDPAVAVAFNNTPFIRNRFFEQEFYDLQRVEVLRGPQGTLYGRNATAGVVNIISQKPKFTYEARASGDISNYSSTRIEGMVNIPLVEDRAALRLAGAWTKRDGYATNQITGNPIDGRDLWSTRLSLRLAPIDTLDVNLIWEHFEEDDDRLRSGKQLCKTHEITEVAGIPVGKFDNLVNMGQGGMFPSVAFSQGCERNSLYAPDSFQTPNGLSLPYYYPLSFIFLPVALVDPYVSRLQSQDLHVIESTVDPEYKAKTDIFEAQVSFDLSDTLTLASETAYARDTIFSSQDYNRFNTAAGAWARPEDIAHWGIREDVLLPGPNGGVFCDPQVGCADRMVAVDLSTAESRHFSQEFRLASDFEGGFNFSVGTNFLRYDTEDKYYVFINSLGLIAAISPYGHQGQLPPYRPGVSDNLECMAGYAPPDPTKIYPIVNCTYMDPNPIGALNDLGHNYFLSKNPYKLISYAVFGEAYYDISDTLKLTAGLRFTVDKKEAPRIPSWVPGSNAVGHPVVEVIRQEWSEPTGRITLDWKPDLAFTDETLLYGSYAHGYKAGGSNPPPASAVMYCPDCGTNANVSDAAVADSATHPRRFDAEFVDAFELGSKNTLFDGRVTANFAAFYYDYKNYQVSEIVNRAAINRNFDVTVWGFEMEADWRPLDNLRLGVKTGYERTRIADGEKAVDLMDRTAGDPNWTLVRPFPTFTANCILPTEMFRGVSTWDGSTIPLALGGVTGGNPGGCELAYFLGWDPVTSAPYKADPVPGVDEGPFSELGYHPGWKGFNPATAPNHGEGIDKDLSGNELPNAPKFTATITADYTIPLPHEWLATLHTDLHWQGQSWWRVFNDHEYNRLDEYFTMNLAAIFTNEDAGWKVMAYVKNVTDETAITGAFLNSDDTGLTTNVFLTEPRLYGLRVTKEWMGDSPFGGFGDRRQGPFPLTVELGGQVQRQSADYETYRPGFAGAFPAALDIFDDAQGRDLDWGDGREAKVTWRPNAGPWTVTGALRYGRTNTDTARLRGQVQTDAVCPFEGKYAVVCDPASEYYQPTAFMKATNWSDAAARSQEKHDIADFAVGRDIGIGGLSRSTVSAGVRYAQFRSSSRLEFGGVPDFDLENFVLFPTELKYGVEHTRFEGLIDAEREFGGVGPVFSWEATLPLLGGDDSGRLGLDWGVSGGVLFGKQKVAIEGGETASLYDDVGPHKYDLPDEVVPTPIRAHRSEGVTVPTFGVSLGLSYTVDRLSLGAGYRWETYKEVLDGGYQQEEASDRSLDGPYFKLAIGFGG